jgi:hypothetical protein
VDTTGVKPDSVRSSVKRADVAKNVAFLEFGGASDMRPPCKTQRCRNRARKDGRDCSRCHQRSWRRSQPISAAFATLRDHAKPRGIEFSISRQEFERFALESDYINRTGLGGSALTVDRIDNLRGYEPGNVQPLTRSANSVKRAKQDAIRQTKGFAWMERRAA